MIGPKGSKTYQRKSISYDGARVILLGSMLYPPSPLGCKSQVTFGSQDFPVPLVDPAPVARQGQGFLQRP